MPEGAIFAMCDTIVLRGTDELGLFTDGEFGFGMRRLAIVDVAGGHQPMTSEDGRHVVTFNGEIFNHPALRRELEGLGHRYRTNSDTESILRGFQQWGPGVWAKLEGMFAVFEQSEHLEAAQKRITEIKATLPATVGKDAKGAGRP